MYIQITKLLCTMCDAPLVDFEFSIPTYNNEFSEHAQTCKYARTKKAQALARQIAQADVLVQQIRNATAENQVLEQRLQEFQQSAQSIQQLYEEEKRQRIEICKKLEETAENYRLIDEELAVKRFELEQLQAQFAECNGPIKYANLVLRYLKLYNKMIIEGQLHKREPAHIVELRKYCEAHNLTIPDCADKSLKKRKLPAAIAKQQQDACTQYISTVTTRGTNTIDLITRQDVGIMCCLPLSCAAQLPTVDIMLRELLQYDISYMQPVSPIPEINVMFTKRTRTVSTCTHLCNIQRKIDFVAVTAEPAATSTADTFEPALFDKLWNGFGCMVFALLNKQRCKAETEQLKNAFSTWMPEVYEVLLAQTGVFPNNTQDYACFENKNEIAKDANSAFQDNQDNIYCNLNRQVPVKSAMAEFLIAKSACDNAEATADTTKRGVKRSLCDSYDNSKKFLISVPARKSQRQNSCLELKDEYKLKIETKSEDTQETGLNNNEFLTAYSAAHVINNMESEETLDSTNNVNTLCSEPFVSELLHEVAETSDELVIDEHMELSSEEDNCSTQNDEKEQFTQQVGDLVACIAKEHQQQNESCIYELEIQSPQHEFEEHNLLCTPKQIPLELDLHIIEKMQTHKNNKHLMFHLLRKYSSKANAAIKAQKNTNLYKLVNKYMEAQANLADIEACYLNSNIKCLDIKHIAKAIAQTTRDSLLFKETATHENQLLQQRILALTSSLQIDCELFKSHLMTEVELLLFKIQNSDTLKLAEVMSLTNLYLFAENIMQTQQHSARLFIAKCLYYYKALSAPMIFAVLCAHPNALPHRDDINYDRTDALLSVIEFQLMSKKYDMDNHELRHRELLSKLRYEYHYLPFQPDRQTVLNNLIAKLRAGDCKDICFVFALFCKRLEQRFVLNDIVQCQLMPLANEWRERKDCQQRLAAVLDCLSVILKPFPLQTDINDFLSFLQQFLNVDGDIIKAAAVRAILRLQRFGHVNCFNALLPLQNTDANFDQLTENMLQTFVHRKSLNFWRTACPEAFDK